MVCSMGGGPGTRLSVPKAPRGLGEGVGGSPLSPLPQNHLKYHGNFFSSAGAQHRGLANCQGYCDAVSGPGGGLSNRGPGSRAALCRGFRGVERPTGSGSPGGSSASPGRPPKAWGNLGLRCPARGLWLLWRLPVAKLWLNFVQPSLYLAWPKPGWRDRVAWRQRWRGLPWPLAWVKS